MDANTVAMKTAQEFLGRALTLQREIENKKRRIQTLRDMATSTTGTMSDMPRSDSPNLQRMETVLCKAADLEFEVDVDKARLDLLKADITEVLSDLEDFREQQVLYARYVAGMEWNSIATECGCARATAIRHHHSGLSHIAERKKNHPEKMILG